MVSGPNPFKHNPYCRRVPNKVQRRLMQRKLVDANARSDVLSSTWPNSVLMSRRRLTGRHREIKHPRPGNLLQPTEFGSNRQSTIEGEWSIAHILFRYLEKEINM